MVLAAGAAGTVRMEKPKVKERDEGGYEVSYRFTLLPEADAPQIVEGT